MAVKEPRGPQFQVTHIVQVETIEAALAPFLGELQEPRGFYRSDPELRDVAILAKRAATTLQGHVAELRRRLYRKLDGGKQ